MGHLSCQRRNCETCRTTTRNIQGFPNQMIEQINIAFEQKRVREFLSSAGQFCRRDYNVRKESIYIN